MRTLIIDNYDSFTFNLYQMIAEISGAAYRCGCAAAGEGPVVVRNDQLEWGALLTHSYDSVIVSPGPGRPERSADVGVSADAIRSAELPVLGVCLGHQAIAHFHGGRVVAAPEVMHGRVSTISHQGSPLFEGIPASFRAVRYHSLAVSTDLPACLEPIAWADDGVLMALRHRRLPLWGVQFHPESIGTEHGRRLLENFLRIAGACGTRRRGAATREGAVRRPGAPDVEVRSRRLDLAVDPERAFVHLFAGEPCAFWLDSSLRAPDRARFSFMGCGGGPRALRVRYRVAERALTVTGRDGDARPGETVLDYLQRALDRRRVRSDDLPFDFNCGFVGYLGYEMKADCGAAAAHRGLGRRAPSGDLEPQMSTRAPLPDAELLFADRLIAFDHEDGATYLVCLAAPGEADAWMDATERALRALPPLPPLPTMVDAPAAIPLRLARDEAAYLADIATCLREIREGETYEVCLTNTIRADARIDPLRLHRILRRASPAPYAAFLRFDDVAIVSSSPERFLRVGRDGWVESRPIKGTLPRGTTPEEDASLRERLRTSEKDRAENLMIVDLTRNDLGVVCEPGTVRVPSMMDVEPYATVHQLVSTIRGRLRADRSAIDCVKAAFPPGSMTGAPKLRTMQILDRIEGAPRGVYSGAIGYFSLSGAADLGVVIRTAVVDPEGASIGVGGAIVALSDPRAEVEEMLLKGRAVTRAIAGAARRVRCDEG